MPEKLQYACEVARKKAHRLVGKGRFSKSDYPDLVQEIVLGVIHYDGKFDPRIGSWYGFVATVCNSRFADILDSRYRQKRSPLREKRLVEVSEFEYTVVKSSQDLFELTQDLSSTIEHMPILLREVCHRLMSGEPKAMIARELEISYKSLISIIDEIRERFDRAGLRYYIA